MTESHVWVVELIYRKPGYTKEKRDTKYVRSKTEPGAIRTAKFHSMLPGTTWRDSEAILRRTISSILSSR